MRIFLILQTLFILGCQKESINQLPDIPSEPLTYLALGDSYTIGESVADSLRWPNLLVDSLQVQIISNSQSPLIVARTGWRTDQLLQFSDTVSIKKWDFVSLLIGVNDFYQNVPSQAFKTKFEEMLDTAIAFAKNQHERVLVVSIPDYGYTPFGQNDQARISAGIDEYNAVVACSMHSKTGRVYLNY